MVLSVSASRCYTEQLCKILHLQFASIEQFASLYTRVKAKGIAPMQTVVDGSGVAISYEDPDGNVLEISTSTLSGVMLSRSMLGSPALQGNIEVNPEGFLDVVQPRGFKDEELDARSLTMLVKTEPVVAEQRPVASPSAVLHL